MGKSKRVFKPKHSLKNKKPRYNKKGGGFMKLFGGDDKTEAPVQEMEGQKMEAPAQEMEVPPQKMEAPAQEMKAPGPGPAPEKECCPCNKGMMNMFNPKDALNKLEGNLIGAQENAVKTVTTTVTDATNGVKEKGKGIFSKLFGSSQAGGRKSKRRTIRKSKGKRKGKGRSKKNKRITRRR